jgi:hypothetical protein
MLSAACTHNLSSLMGEPILSNGLRFSVRMRHLSALSRSTRIGARHCVNQILIRIGLVRKSIAPAFMPFTDMEKSPSWMLRFLRQARSSSPLVPSSRTSTKTRSRGRNGQLGSRNSEPIDRMRLHGPSIK